MCYSKECLSMASEARANLVNKAIERVQRHRDDIRLLTKGLPGETRTWLLCAIEDLIAAEAYLAAIRNGREPQ
jgi:hypothetical protein